ncbi:MAG: pentapeptide repeat-containing protein [Chloroflexi bacterium]|uniref:Pentapeptide repeat-containing protein n=1 Tax=Candidatus Chlorohelix allophototropha TaxID=3003348 RepID=A0A8T7LTW3_9CHLR|nr:pentapeptide repeat-containing protein [Chloroflexota bacterium]WJW66207.1 pentapeptide repeat-containing protein [Chloroflexota bacterium L227-S17]
MLTTIMLGNKISEARKEKNLSQSQLAQQLSISSQAVGKWERGESMPDIITFNRLAEVLGVDLNYFSEGFQAANMEKASAEPSTESPSEIQEKKPSWDLSQGNWVDADFSGLKNLGEKFSASNMQRCLFIGSEMSGLLLESNNVDSCDFSNSDISNSHIQTSNLVNSSFRDCSLKEAEFSSNQIKNCDFSGADFTGAVFKVSAVLKTKMSGAIWNRTTFYATQITAIVFDGTFNDCSFENCEFSKVIFQNATLTNTFFKNKSMKRIRFINCKADKLTYAFLKSGKADITDITLLTS